MRFSVSLLFASALVLGGCGGASGPVTVDPAEVPASPTPQSSPASPSGPAPTGVPQVTCSGMPDAGPAGDWRHSLESPIIVASGAPVHRGIDLVAGASDAVQPIRGVIAYGTLDKALEDENVDLFACRAASWQPIGSAITDDEGGFELDLTGSARLPIGERPLYASVTGDRSGVEFLGLVVPDGSALAVSDVDGTLTSSENAFTESLVTGAEVAPQPGAPQALAALASRGYFPVYLTARGNRFTADTRAWLAQNGFPTGPLRLADSTVTLPGSSTVAYKAGAMAAFEASGLTVAVGIGNRASDVEAYQQAKVPAQQTFVKLPEYQSELQPLLDAGLAIGFSSYVAETAVFAALPPAP